MARSVPTRGPLANFPSSSCMNIAHNALDDVDYNALGADSHPFCTSLDCDSEEEMEGINPETLQDLVALTIVSDEKLLCLAMDKLPSHFAALFFKSALLRKEMISIAIIVSEWPHDELVLKRIVPELQESLFRSVMVFDTAMVMGLMRRNDVPDKVRLKVLDLRGFPINEVFSRVLIGSLSVLSLPKAQRNVDTLLPHVLKFLQKESVEEIAEEERLLENDLRAIINKKLDFPTISGGIYVPTGEKLLIKVDRLDFGRDSNSFIDFMVCGALREITPCVIQAHNLAIQTCVNDNERLIDSCTPFLALLGQDPDILQGLSLNNLEDMLFQYILKGVARFENLTALDIGNCNISIVGRTRVRVALRERILQVFSLFKNLQRLDVRGAELTNSLPELLNSLRRPLTYLNLSGCALSVADLAYLQACKHTESLRELHLSSLVHSGGDIPTARFVLECVEAMVDNLVVLELQRNDLGPGDVATLCALLPRFKRLKLLDTLYNLMGEDGLKELLQTAAISCPSLHCLAMNLVPVVGGGHAAVMHRRRNFQMQCQALLAAHQRTDITLVVVAIGIE